MSVCASLIPRLFGYEARTLAGKHNLIGAGSVVSYCTMTIT